MRRIALIFASMLVACGTVVAATAGADDSHTYRVELDNAFGIVNGSEVRVAGVAAGTVTGLDVNEAKRAVLTVEISGALSTFRESATCSSEPQSLIAEYFLDCQPGTKGDVLPDGGLVPVRSEAYGDQTFTTVQSDLVNNTLREPFKVRLALIFNEFGTALAGNPENLNQAIRRGAPALQALRKALAILARQNAVIRDLNVNSDRIVSRLADRRRDVIAFIRNANTASAASAERREDLARNFELLPGFLTELRPTLARLGELADEQTPLLVDLRGAAPELNRLTRTLPPFNDATEPSVRTLGEAAETGRRALEKGGDEIRALRQSTGKSFSAADALANFLVDLDDPRRAVENDTRAARDTGRANPTGYTGLEGLLNYVYYQTLAVNQFDSVGHLLHFTLAEFEAGPCGEYNADTVVPSASGGETTSASDRNRCVAWIGPTQPGINQPINVEPYHPSVCPQGSTDPELCASSAPSAVAARRPAASEGGEAQGGGAGAGGGNGQGGEAPLVPGTPGLPDLPQIPGVDPSGLGGLLDGLGGSNGGRGPGNGLGGLLNGPGNGGGGGNPAAQDDLLNFLFGN
jgi:ABC-type transporter Mla subunit MlaD